MKRATALLLALLCACGLVGCKKEPDVLHLGLNAEIIEIDGANQIFYVADPGSEDVFGERCGIDCTRDSLMYVDYGTGELYFIQFEDFQVGDAVIIGAYDSQLAGLSDGTIPVKQIQLGTQRLTLEELKAVS